MLSEDYMKNYLKFTISLFTVMMVATSFVIAGSGQTMGTDNSKSTGTGSFFALVDQPILITLVTSAPEFIVAPGTTKAIATEFGLPDPSIATHFEVTGKPNSQFSLQINVIRTGTTKINLLNCAVRTNGVGNIPQNYQIGNFGPDVTNQSAMYASNLTGNKADVWFWPKKIQVDKDAVPGDKAIFTVTVTVSYYQDIY